MLGGLLPTPQGEWLIDASEAQTTVDHPSFRVALLFDLSGSGDQPGTCHFDDIGLFEVGAESVVEVPVTSHLGLVLLGSALGLAALWVLRRG